MTTVRAIQAQRRKSRGTDFPKEQNRMHLDKCCAPVRHCGLKVWVQCNMPNGHGPGGLFCRLHIRVYGLGSGPNTP